MRFVVPIALKVALADQKVPSWVSEAYKLQSYTLVADLPTVAEINGSASGKALEHFFTMLISRKLKEKNFRDLKISPESTIVLDANFIAALRLSVRTTNCLMLLLKENSGQIQLSALTFGDLTQIPNMGAKSLLEFLESIGEHDDASSNEGPNFENLYAEIIEKIRDPIFAELIVGDLRFPSLSKLAARIDSIRGQPVNHIFDESPFETFTQGDLQVINSVLDEVKLATLDLAILPLNEVVAHYISLHYGRGKKKTLEGIYPRFGIGSSKTLTLEECGSIVGLTRERIRQIESKVKKNFVKTEAVIFMPKLDDALKLLRESSAMEVDHFQAELVSRGISKTPISIQGLKYFAEVTNRETPDVYSEMQKDGQLLISSGKVNYQLISTVGRRLFSKNGVASLKLAIQKVSDLGLDVKEEDLAKEVLQFLIGSSSWVDICQDGQWWVPSDYADHGRNRLINITKKILSVSNPVGIDEIRDGFIKVQNFRNSSSSQYSSDNLIVVPSKAALLAFFDLHDDFEVQDQFVSTELVLDYRKELGEVEAAFVDIGLSSSNGILTRADLMDGCRKRGLSENSVTVYSTYSSILQHVAIDTFKLIGKSIDPAAVSAHQAKLSQQIRTKRILLCDWKDGRIRIIARCPKYTNTMVLGAPGNVKSFLINKKFHAVQEGETPCGTIAINEQGSIYGFNRFCSTNHVEEDDLLAVEFDLLSNKAHLHITFISDIIEDIE